MGKELFLTCFTYFLIAPLIESSSERKFFENFGCFDVKPNMSYKTNTCPSRNETVTMISGCEPISEDEDVIMETPVEEVNYDLKLEKGDTPSDVLAKIRKNRADTSAIGSISGMLRSKQLTASFMPGKRRRARSGRWCC